MTLDTSHSAVVSAVFTFSGRIGGCGCSPVDPFPAESLLLRPPLPPCSRPSPPWSAGLTVLIPGAASS